MTLKAAPLEETAKRLRSGTDDPRDYIEDVCDRFEQVEPDIRAFLPETDRTARLRIEARQLETSHAWRNDRPPLYGIPVGVKDLIHVDGFPTQAGSDLPPEELGGPEGTVIETLRDAGVIFAGKTVMTEFAFKKPGPTRNPHDLNHTPGGSSSGSAAAVAAGLCPLALGTQTAGSTLRPASYCGIVGYKSSHGRIPMDGIIRFAPTADHLGLYTQTVAGMRLAASLVCTDWNYTESAEGKPALAVPEGPLMERATEAGLDSFDRQIERLEAAGFGIRSVPLLEHLDAIEDRHYTMQSAEVAQIHHHWYEAYSDRYHPDTAGMIEDGWEVTVRELLSYRAKQNELRERIEETMAEGDIDLWICPASPGPAPEGLETTGDPIMNLPWTNAGLPAVSVPADQSTDGLPMGLQCIAGFGADEQLIEWAEQLEAVFEAGISG